MPTELLFPICQVQSRFGLSLQWLHRYNCSVFSGSGLWDMVEALFTQALYQLAIQFLAQRLGSFWSMDDKLKIELLVHLTVFGPSTPSVQWPSPLRNSLRPAKKLGNSKGQTCQKLAFNKSQEVPGPKFRPLERRLVPTLRALLLASASCRRSSWTFLLCSRLMSLSRKEAPLALQIAANSAKKLRNSPFGLRNTSKK